MRGSLPSCGLMVPNDESILTKEYGIRANIIIQDDFVAGRNAFLNGDIDLIYCTTDVLAVEMGEGSAMNSAKYVMMPGGRCNGSYQEYSYRCRS